MTDTFWRRCSNCKREMGFSQAYWTCSVSTCNRRGSSFVFCSVGCWQAHVPTVRHRDAWADEQQSPTRERWISASAEPSSSDKPTVAVAESSEPATSSEVPREILIVASKLKKYVRARSGMNTSDGVMEILSRRVRALCDEAIVRAQSEGRRTVLDRDF